MGNLCFLLSRKAVNSTCSLHLFQELVQRVQKGEGVGREELD